MPDFVIKTQFRGADKLSPVLKKLGIESKRTGDKASRSFRRASKDAKVFGGVVKGILAAGIVQRGFALAGQSVRALGEEFLDFDKNITKAVTRLPGGLDRNSQAFREMGMISRREAARTEFSAAQTGAAIEQLALAGFNLEQSMAALPGTINLATNANIAVEEATTIAAKSLGAFGLKVKDTAQLQKNLTRVNDVFSKTVSSATLDITGLFETLKFGGPAAFAAGQSIETFSALTGVMADSAIDASIAGTSMRRMFLELTKNAKQVKLKRIGVDVKDASGNFRDFLDILQDVAEGTKNMAEVQRLSTLEQIFGARAVNAVNVLLQRGVGNIRKFRGELEKSQGASKKMADTIRDALGNRLLILRSALIELGLKFIDAFKNDGGKALDSFIKKVQKFDVKPVVAQVKDLVKVMKDLLAIVKPFAKWLPEIIVLWGSFKVALAAVKIGMAIKSFIALAAGIKGAAVSMGVLNALFFANPIGFVIAAIAALIGIIALLVIHWDKVSVATQDFIGNVEIGFIRMKMMVLKVVQTMINGVLEIISAAPKAFAKIFGIEIEALDLPRVEFDFTDELSQIKAIRQQTKEMNREAAGMGVARGVAGIRGGGLRGRGRAVERAMQTSDVVSAMEREFEIPQQVTNFGPAEQAAQLAQEQTRAKDIAREAVQAVLSETALQAPNRSEVDAQKMMLEGRFFFENAPAGMSFEAKTTGGKPIKTEGLGTQ